MPPQGDRSPRSGVAAFHELSRGEARIDALPARSDLFSAVDPYHELPDRRLFLKALALPCAAACALAPRRTAFPFLSGLGTMRARTIPAIRSRRDSTTNCPTRWFAANYARASAWSRRAAAATAGYARTAMEPITRWSTRGLSAPTSIPSRRSRFSISFPATWPSRLQPRDAT